LAADECHSVNAYRPAHVAAVKTFNSTRNIREAWLISLDAAYARQVAEVETRVVEGYFKCPVRFTVDVEALRGKYSAVVGGEPLILRLPSAEGVDRSHDELSAPPLHYSEREDLLSNRPEMAPFWGRIVVWTANFGAPKAGATRQFAGHFLDGDGAGAGAGAGAGGAITGAGATCADGA
jgi:hypothetical protein